ncbi:MAG: hypothetical protein WA728_02960 [Xanthobacteraceae bacterium]
MTRSEFSPTWFSLYWLLYPFAINFVFSLIISVVAILFFRTQDRVIVQLKSVFSLYFSSGIPISLIGFLIGFMTGLSREPAVGNVLPAVLTLIGGLIIYVFGTQSDFKVLVGYCVSLLVCSLFYGLENGSFVREGYREPHLNALFEEEARLRNQRQLLNLPTDPPAWIVAEPK